MRVRVLPSCMATQMPLTLVRTAEVSMSVLVDGQRQCDPDVVLAEKRGQWAKPWALDD